MPVGTGVLRSMPRSRQHGEVLQPPERRELERAGWRTTLDYRENHVRSVDGRLLRIEPVWIAVAERFDGNVSVASAEGSTAEVARITLSIVRFSSSHELSPRARPTGIVALRANDRHGVPSSSFATIIAG